VESWELVVGAGSGFLVLTGLIGYMFNQQLNHRNNTEQKIDFHDRKIIELESNMLTREEFRDILDSTIARETDNSKVALNDMRYSLKKLADDMGQIKNDLAYTKGYQDRERKYNGNIGTD